jgi:RND superfamily putative drug exporter
MARMLYRIGRGAARRGWWVIAGFVAVAVLLGVLGRTVGGETADTFEIPGTESQQAFDLLDERFPQQSGSTANVVFHATGGTLDDAAARAAVTETLGRLAEGDHVVAVADPYDPASTAVSDDRTIAYAEVRYDVRANELDSAAVDALERAAEPAREAGLQVEYGGDVVASASQTEPASSELIGLGVAIIVLLVAFGSVIAMGLPLVIAIVGLGIGLSLITLLASLIELNSAGPILATMIGLGVGIDYALFIVTRYRQFLHDGLDVPEAAGRAIATSGSAVVFAGVTVVIAILGLQVAGLPMVTSMGYAAAITVAVMVVASIVLLPALLGVVGHRIDRLRVPGIRARAESTHRSFGARWVEAVARHPWRSLGAGLAVLAILTVPLFSIRLGTADDGTQPTSSTLRRSYDLLSEGFGPGFNGPLLVAVDLRDAQPELLVELGARLADEPAVRGVTTAIPNPEGDTAVLTVYPDSKPQDEATEQLIHHLRQDVIPGIEQDLGGQVYVSGSTAAFIDLSDKVSSRLPWFVATVIGLSFLLLMAVFRSVLVPLKAALMNLLAIGASYGVVVAIFQWGWMKDVFGVDQTVPIISFLPMMMFAILFGLSMDYEVFILSRVHEEWLRTGDSRRSVVDGISATARVITSAAIIMISVFGAFMLGDDTLIKMFGFGMAFAVFIDATLVRMVLVPATMELLGGANWWLPSWLDRILPRIDVEGAHAFDEPVTVAPVDADLVPAGS